VVAWHIEATGGEAAYRQIKNRVAKATFEAGAQGIKGSITIYGARPNLLYKIAEIPGGLKREVGTDGNVAWQRDSVSGVQLAQGDRREQIMRQAEFDSTVGWRKLYKSAETLGVETVAGRPAYKVQFTINAEDKMVAYYNKESHLLVKTVATQKVRGVVIPTETFLGDYKEVGGVLMAHQYTVRAKKQERVITFDSIEVNTELEKGLFELPAEVKELLKKKEAEPKKTDQTP